MNNKCAVCNEQININNNVYRGFDCTFCSTYCRTKMWSKIYQKDINFAKPELWSDKNDKNDINKKYKWDVYIKSKQDKLDKLDKLDKQDKQDIKISESKKQNEDNKINFNIYEDNTFEYYYNYKYNCTSYSIYDIIPFKNITNYILESMESSISLFR